MLWHDNVIGTIQITYVLLSARPLLPINHTMAIMMTMLLWTVELVQVVVVRLDSFDVVVDL
jgi:hypothetical protein